MISILLAAPLAMGAGALGAGALAARNHWACQRKATLAHEQGLLTSAATAPSDKVDLAALQHLPAPVLRYFHHALQDGQPIIRAARFRQHGKLRSGAHSQRWLNFEADQLVVPAARGFLWQARVGLGAAMPIHVNDSYQSGIAASQVSVLSAFTLAAHSGGHEMHAGALHRYLAEAVWYPTALLPAAGVRWTAIDAHRALASLSDAGETVSLEFRFAPSGAVAGIYTPRRWRSLNGGFCQTRWEGNFDACIELAGMRVPAKGEVGWYIGGYADSQWRPVGQGRMDTLVYEFAASPS